MGYNIQDCHIHHLLNSTCHKVGNNSQRVRKQRKRIIVGSISQIVRKKRKREIVGSISQIVVVVLQVVVQITVRFLI